MSDLILDRILRDAAVPDLFGLLSDRLEPTDLQSLLLAVYKTRAEKITPATLLQQYQRNRFVQPASTDPRRLLELDRLAYSLLPPDFDAVELSPVAPLGANSALATVDQNKVVTTTRNTEVCADSTNVLALECAARRQALYRAGGSVPPTKLAASHRLLRAQQFEGAAMFTHFRVFGLVTGGRDRGSYRFETEALREHIRLHVRLIQSVTPAASASQIIVTLSAFDESHLAVLKSEVLEPLAAVFASVRFEFDQARPSGRGYYLGTAFQVNVADAAGSVSNFADGGFTDWTQKLLSNRKERLLISGIGTQRLLQLSELSQP